MEPAKPILETPKEDINLILGQVKEFKIINNGKEYIIQIGKTTIKEKIGFKIKEKSSSEKIIYDIYLSLEELQNISRSFRVFDNIDEALASIEDIFQENNANLKIENNNLFLDLQVNKMGKGKEIVEINLQKRALSLKETNEILENDIKVIKIEVEQLKNDNKFLKEEIESIKKREKNEIDFLKKEIEILKKEIEKLTINLNQAPYQIKTNNSIDSRIIEKKEELDLIENRLKHMEQFQNQNLKYKLIFRGTRDGKLPSDFHNKVDGKDKTITIIESTKGLIIWRIY